jgi:hypothetical protein
MIKNGIMENWSICTYVHVGYIDLLSYKICIYLKMGFTLGKNADKFVEVNLAKSYKTEIA